MTDLVTIAITHKELNPGNGWKASALTSLNMTIIVLKSYELIQEPNIYNHMKALLFETYTVSSGPLTAHSHDIMIPWYTVYTKQLILVIFLSWGDK